MELDDVLNDNPPEPVVEAPVAEAPAEPVTPANVEKTGKKAFQEKERAARDAGAVVPEEPKPELKPEPKAEPKVEPKVEPKQEMSDKERAFLAQAIDERNKRQALEARLKALEAAQQPQEPSKTFWDDPESKFKEFEQKMSGVVTNTRLNTTEMIARSKHPDFDENLAVFQQIVQNTPGIWQQALDSPDPAEFAYKTGKNYKDLQDAGNIDTLKDRIEKEVRIKIEAELKAKEEAKIKERAALPGSLSDVTGARQQRVVWDGPSSLNSILHDK